MIFNDVIHVQAEKGRENRNAKGIGISEVDDYFYVMHDV
jgi:hypothetical protein